MLRNGKMSVEDTFRAEIATVQSEASHAYDGVASWLHHGWGKQHDARLACDRALSEKSLSADAAIEAFEASCSSRVPSSVVAASLDALRRLIVASLIPSESLRRCSALADSHATSPEPVGLRAVQVGLAVLTCDSASSKCYDAEAARLAFSAIARPVWSNRASDSARAATQGALRQALSLLIERAPFDASSSHPRSSSAYAQDALNRAYEDAASGALNTIAEWASGDEGQWVGAHGFPRAEAFAQLEHCICSHSEHIRCVPSLRAALAGKICPLLLSCIQDKPSGVSERSVLLLSASVLRRLHNEAHAECCMIAHALSRLAERNSNNALAAITSVLSEPHAVASLRGSELGHSLAFAYENATASVGSGKAFLPGEHPSIANEVASSSGEGPNNSDQNKGEASSGYGDSSSQHTHSRNSQMSSECAVLAIEGLLALSYSLLALAQLDVEEQARVDGAEAFSETWQCILRTFTSALARCSTGPVMHNIMKGCAACAVAAGSFELSDARDCFMAALAHYALAEGDPPMEPSEGDVVGSGPLAHALHSLGRAHYPGKGAKRRVKKSVVSFRNQYAFDELAWIARELDEKTESGWTLILEAAVELEYSIGLSGVEQQEVDLRLLSRSKSSQEVEDDARTHTSESADYRDKHRTSAASFKRFGSSVRLPTLENQPVTLARGGRIQDVMSELISRTKEFSSKELCKLLSAVKQVSTREMREVAGDAASTPPGASGATADTANANGTIVQGAGSLKLSTLHFMSQIVGHNIFRLEIAWEYCIRERVHTALANGQSAIRSEGLACLDRLVHLVLGASEGKMREADGESERAQLDEWCVTELRAIALSDHFHGEIRLAALKQLNGMLQAHGENLMRSTWRRIMAFLNDTSTSSLFVIEGAMQTAFSAVELIMQDYIGLLPADLIDQAAELVHAHCRKQEDINAALSAVGLLWNIADFAAGEDTSKETGMSRHDKALESVLIALHALSLDERSEVRHASLRALASAIASHCQSLHDDLWQEACINMLFQLPKDIETIVEKLRHQSDGESSARGLSAANSTTAVQHHSRDTASKQWEETLSLCLSCCAKVFRSHMHRITSLEGFDDRWYLFIETCLRSFSNFSSAAEVPASLCSPLSCYGRGSGLTEQHLRMGLHTLARMAMQPNVDARARAEVGSSAQRMLAASAGAGAEGITFSAQHVQILLGIEEAVALTDCFQNSYSESTNNRDVMLQWSSAMDALSGFPPYISDASASGTWNLLLSDLLCLTEGDLHGCKALEQLQTEIGGEVRLAGGALASAAQRSDLLRLRERALDALTSVYCKHAPSRIRAQHMARAVRIVRACSAVDETNPQGKMALIKASGQAFGQLVSQGLPAVNTVALSNQEQREVWTAMLDAYRAFIALDGYDKESYAALQSLIDDALSACAQASTSDEDIVASMVHIVAEYSKRSSSTSLRKLATLCERGGQKEQAHSCYMRVAQLAFPHLLELSQVTLTRINDEGKRSDERLERASDMLACADIIGNLVIDGAVAFAEESGSRQGERAQHHLPMLYKELVGCVTAPEQSVREAVHALLAAVGRHLCLM